MTTTIISSGGVRLNVSSGNNLSDHSLNIVLNGATLRSFKPQDLFDALRAEGFVDKPKTELDKIKDAVRELEVGQRFKFLGTPTIYVRDENYTFTDTGEGPDSWRYGTMGIDGISNRDLRGVEVLPDPPKGDEVVRNLTRGTRFSVYGVTYMKTSSRDSIDLSSGMLRSPGFFAGSPVEVSK